MNSRLLTRAGVAAALGLLVVVAVPPMGAQWLTSPSTSVVPTAQLMQAEDLNRILHGPRSARPLVLQVGSHVLFTEAHIPGSEYAGPGSSDDGLNTLRNRIKALPRATFIVLYCGCCPWNHCPNVGPAYTMLNHMGFTRVKVLYLADNLGADWVDKGYPVARGQ